jgi:hypothetical protein
VITQVDIPAPVATRELAGPPTGPSGPLGPHDSVVSDEDLAADLDALLVIGNQQLQHINPTLYVLDAMGKLVMPGGIVINRLEEAHARFGGELKTANGQTVAQYLARALGQVGYLPDVPNETKYNSWFAGLYGDVFRDCAWCAIFQCWVGIPGAIPSYDRSAGALALADRFPDKGRVPGTLIGYNGEYFPDGHIEVNVKSDGADYTFTVGGNTVDNGLHPAGVWYVHRYLPGNVQHYGMPDYTTVPDVHDHVNKEGKLALTGVFGHYTIDHLKHALNNKRPPLRVKPLPINGLFHVGTTKTLQKYLGDKKPDGVFGQHWVKVLQAHLHVTQDGDWGPLTTKAMQRRLNEGTF